MEINATLIGQALGFALFVWLTMRYVWPVITKAMADRETRIADGLAAAERGRKDLDNARERAEVVLREARDKAGQLIDHGHRRADELVEQAREQAVSEREQQVRVAREEIEQESNRAREALRRELSAIALQAAERILQREIDPEAHRALLDELATQI